MIFLLSLLSCLILKVIMILLPFLLLEQWGSGNLCQQPQEFMDCRILGGMSKDMIR